MDIKEIENKEYKIVDLDNNARGIAKNEGIIYFIEYAKLGEIVNIKVKNIKKNFIEAIKTKIVHKSSLLNDYEITENRLCGIFDIYDLKYENQIKFKEQQIINTINRISHENIEDIDFIEADEIFNYRNKIELKVDLDGNLSFFSRKSNNHVKISDCIMATKEINNIIPTFQNLIKKHKFIGYNPSTNTGFIKNIIFRSTSLGETMGIMIVNELKDLKLFYRDLEDSKIFNSFYISYNNKKRNYKILDLVHIFGKEKIKENMGNFQFKISPKAFFQINKDIAYKIYLQAREYIKSINPDLIIDMYSGISTTSIILSDIAKKIISVEINKDAVKDGIENAKLNNISNIEFLDKAAEEAIKSIELNNKNTVALFDPPRKGLDFKIIEKIGNSKINNIVYISCNPSTLARDIKLFKEYGFKIKEIKAYDQFVNTIESEAITLLSRSESSADNSK